MVPYRLLIVFIVGILIGGALGFIFFTAKLKKRIRGTVFLVRDPVDGQEYMTLQVDYGKKILLYKPDTLFTITQINNTEG